MSSPINISGLSTGIQWGDIVDSTIKAYEARQVKPITDRITKRELYLDNGVAEYWIVDLDARVFERWRLTQHTPELFRNTITWTPREGSSLTIDLPTYFDRVAAKDRMHERWRRTRQRTPHDRTL